MTVKRKDFQKAAAFLQDFLLKLSDDMECAELRDSLNLVLLYMQKYYKSLQNRSHEKTVQHSLNMSLRGLSPLTPFIDAPDKFQWKWINLDSQRLTSSMPLNESASFTLPSIIQSAKQGDIKHMLSLIRRDADCVDDRDGIGRSALSYAVHFHQIDSLKILLQNNADVNVTAHDGSTCLHQACHDSNYIALHILLEFGADLNIQDNLGRYPIHWAAATPSNDCLRLLIQYKTDMKVCDKEGMTASMWACRLDHIKHLELLSQADTSESMSIEDIERDHSGRTWMHWSIRRTEPLECLQTLLTEETAKIKDKEGKTVLLLAAEQGSLESCRVIVDIAGGGCIRDADDQNRSPLHLATMGGHGDCVNFFLEQHADLNAVDKYNATAWDYARNRQLHYCQLILMSHQRQRLGSNRSTPYGFDASMLNGDVTVDDDYDYLAFYNSMGISQHQPLTPPHPPKRPRRSMNGQHVLTRRANSLPQTPQMEHLTDRTALSAGNERNVLKVHGPDRCRTDDSLPLGMSTPYSTHQYVGEDGDHGRMEVSDEGDNHFIPHPPTTPLYTQPTPPITTLQPPIDHPTYPVQPTPPTAPLQPTPPVSPLHEPKTHQTVVKNKRGLLLTMPANENQQASNPPTSPVTPPTGFTPQQRQLWQPSPPITPHPSTSPIFGATASGTARQPLHRPTVSQHVASSITPPKPDGSRPGSGSSQEQVSNTQSSVDTVRTVISHRSAHHQHATLLDGKKMPPPVLTPLKYAPQPPVTDENMPHRTKRKKKKKRQTSPTQNSAYSQPPAPTAADFGPTVKRAPSAAPRALTRGTSSVPHPQPALNTPQKREARLSESSMDTEKTPPMVSGHACPLSAHPDRASARPRYQLHPPADESPPSTSDRADALDDTSAVSEDGDGVGPLIPPPQAFRGQSGRPQPHPRHLAASIPLDGQSFRSLSAAGKPPLPHGVTMSASSQRNQYRRHRTRPNTGNSTNI